jgi:hypothetical protein
MSYSDGEYDDDDDDWDDDYEDDDNDISDASLATDVLRDIDIAAPTYRTRSKLQAVINTLLKVRWSFRQFLHAWIKEAHVLKHRRYRTASRRRDALLETLAGMPSIIGQLHLVPVFTEELDALICKPYFGRFDHTAHIDDIDFDAAISNNSGDCTYMV